MKIKANSLSFMPCIAHLIPFNRQNVILSLHVKEWTFITTNAVIRNVDVHIGWTWQWHNVFNPLYASCSGHHDMEQENVNFL